MERSGSFCGSALGPQRCLQGAAQNEPGVVVCNAVVLIHTAGRGGRSVELILSGILALACLEGKALLLSVLRWSL